jgi:hypothetical protein
MGTKASTRDTSLPAADKPDAPAANATQHVQQTPPCIRHRNVPEQLAPGLGERQADVLLWLLARPDSSKQASCRLSSVYACTCSCDLAGGRIVSIASASATPAAR